MESSTPRSIRARTSASCSRIHLSHAAASAMSLPGSPESAKSFSVPETSAKLRKEAFFSAEKTTAEHKTTIEKNAKHRGRSKQSAEKNSNRCVLRGRNEKPAERATMLR